MTLDELGRPGPTRSAAVGAIAGTLTMAGACCRDRAHALAPGLLDAAIDAARTVGPRPAELELEGRQGPPVYDATRPPAHERTLGPGPVRHGEDHGHR